MAQNLKFLQLYDAAGNLRREIPVRFKGKLSEAIWLSGIHPGKSFCAGVGLCGRCKVRFLNASPEISDKEKKFFPQNDLDLGWRLACQHNTEEAWPEFVKLELPEEDWENNRTRIPPARKGFHGFASLGVDLGTTSLAWKVADNHPDLAALAGSTANPQCAAGADVISRILAAQSGKGPILRELVLAWLQKLLSSLGNCGVEITRICIAANSAMTGILWEKDLAGLAKAPYFLDFQGGCEIRMPEIGPPLLFPPLIGPFIGGDVTAGLLAAIERKPEPPFLLVDLGTNGEIALYVNEEKIFFASVPMGPAMEGIGPRLGSQPGSGVATLFRLAANGLKPYDQAGTIIERVKGISATGYISLLAWLKKLRFLDNSGDFCAANSCKGALAAKIPLCDGEDGVDIGNGAKLFREDVEILLLVKAAFSVAVNFLLETAGIAASDVKTVLMAGALGQFVNYDDLSTLGFFPQSFSGKLQAAGNTSLAGACILAENPKEMGRLSRLCEVAKVLNLAGDARFQEKYLASLEWKWQE